MTDTMAFSSQPNRPCQRRVFAAAAASIAATAAAASSPGPKVRQSYFNAFMAPVSFSRGHPMGLAAAPELQRLAAQPHCSNAAQGATLSWSARLVSAAGAACSAVALRAFGGGRFQGSRFGRREEQEMRTAAKRKREADQFFAYQRRILQSGRPQPGGGAPIGGVAPRAEYFWRREEFALFKTKHVSAGIQFDQYDNIPVERRGGRGGEEPVTSFQQLVSKFDLPKELVDNIKRCDYQVPTPVQKHSMPAAILGTDVMVAAQTGSGKTCAFLVPLVAGALQARQEPIQAGAVKPKAVILSPTRELCQQIAVEARRLCFKSRCRAVSIYGGADALPQLQNLAEGCDLAICTPGRLDDFISRGVISMEEVKYLVLDEADRMLDMGFEPQIRSIVEDNGMPRPGGKDGRRTLMFSATFPKEMQYLARDFLDESYLWVSVGRVGSTASSVEQNFVNVSGLYGPKKMDILLETLNKVKNANGGPAKTIVFANQKTMVSDIVQELRYARVQSREMHGGLSQAARDRSLDDLRSGRADVLVATDVAARGLDLPGVDHVINFDLPQDDENYVHRVGRTGRMGNTGIATSFVDRNDPSLKAIVQSLRTPNGKDSTSTTVVPDWMQDMVPRSSRRSSSHGRKPYGGSEKGSGKGNGRGRDLAEMGVGGGGKGGFGSGFGGGFRKGGGKGRF